ncbi:MAG: carboxypeptidase-like regulatory domain-containing protein [Polaribacter sp.]|nr:carboxypeptidase-like regulatory domain-containing protein [Polaribacter sp.]
MKKYALLLLLISAQSFCQQVVLKGQVLNKRTKAPVAYVNLSFLKRNIGISSTEDGTFTLEIDNKQLNQKVHVSCLNYKDTIVVAKELQYKPLYLTPKNYELKEVVISKKLDREFEIDKFRRKDLKSGFGGTKGNPWIVAKYFRYEDVYKNTPYLKNVTVYFTSLVLRKRARFRIRFFKINEITGEPSEDLIKDDVIVNIKKIHGKIKVAISKFDIEFPKEGFFVGLERLHIPYNFYKTTYTMQGSRKKYKKVDVAPIFAGTEDSKNSCWAFESGKWFNWSKFMNKNQIKETSTPAISLTLSN